MRNVGYTIAVMVLLFGFDSTSAFGGQENGHYELKENEWLFIDGEEYRFMDVFYNSENESLYVNGIIVRTQQEPTKNLQPTSGLAVSDTFYSRVPLISELINGNMSHKEAVTVYQNKIKKLRYWAEENMTALRADRISMVEARRLAEEELAKGKYMGCMKALEIKNKNTILWHPMSSQNPLLIMWSTSNPEKREGNDLVEEYVECFQRSQSSEVVLMSSGNFSHIGGKNVDVLVEQLKRTIETKKYQPGPFSKYKMLAYGFGEILDGGTGK